jgi:hypothetical protein
MAKAKSKKPVRKNPVAKHGARINRAATHKDRKKAAKRGATKYPPPNLIDE